MLSKLQENKLCIAVWGITKEVSCFSWWLVSGFIAVILSLHIVNIILEDVSVSGWRLPFVVNAVLIWGMATMFFCMWKAIKGHHHD